MEMTRHRLLSQRHFGWLLWLVLLLPIAQTAATWHVLSHARSGQSDDSSQTTIHQGQCDLCFSAAALLGGLPLRSADQLPASTAVGNEPRSNPRAIHISALVLAYDSRAPPFSLL